jgi:hypothetical protein
VGAANMFFYVYLVSQQLQSHNQNRTHKMFVKCPHTCDHPKGKTESGIIWSKGSTYTTHVQSNKVHPSCDATCPAYDKKKHQHDDVTAEDWRQFGNATFERFFKRKNRNLLALSAIPAAFLNEGNREKLSTVVVQGSQAGEQTCHDLLAQ